MNTGKRIPATLTAILAILALTACGETPKGDGQGTHRPEPANDPTICAICGAPLTDSTSSICPDCRELEKDW